MTGYTFMPEDRPRILNRSSDVEILTLRIVSGNEVEAAWIFVIDAGRVHETTRTGGLEGLGSLADIERTDVIRN